jgi:cytidine deaminase
MGTKKPDTRFRKALENFSPSVLESIRSIVENGGMLSPERCQVAMRAMDISVESLMQRLLPVAKLYSLKQISNFQVGSVAKARMSNNENDFALFLGANIEFPSQSLSQTIHAEQSAVLNAWLAGAIQIDSIAVTAAPCGLCRQFICELKGGRDLEIIICNPENGHAKQQRLTHLLPGAFCPQDLGVETCLMELPHRLPDLALKNDVADKAVMEALRAAKDSHAPYSGNYAGCIIETVEGKRYAGRYAENAAFNPSLSPLHTAIIKMVMDGPGMDLNIRRAVMVEKPTAITQRSISELLLQTIAPNVTLEYFEAY